MSKLMSQLVIARLYLNKFESIMIAFAYVGPFVHSLELSRLQFVHFGLIGVDADGTIQHVSHASFDGVSIVVPRSSSKWIGALLDKPAIATWLQGYRNKWPDCQFSVTASSHQFLCPGFVDTHTHAPQYVNAGLGLDLPLLEWLEKYTFPREAEFCDDQHALEVYSRTVYRHIVNGSTTCAYFGTVHSSGTMRLVDVVNTMGQRALVGKVNQDSNSPDSLIESTAASYNDTVDFVDYCDKISSDLITPIITPRFVPSCSKELMIKLGSLATERNLPIQSHLSENLNELAWVRQLFPDIATYTEVYSKFGLLTEKTIMAHCIHLSDEEIQLLKSRKAGVSHCATSNFDLCSGICPVRKLLDAGVKIGLGTDVSGGYHPGMLEAIRSTILASKVLSMQDASVLSLSVDEAFNLATVGGADICGMSDRIGNFVVGKQFDAILVNMDQMEEATAEIGAASLLEADKNKSNNIDLWTHDTLETMFSRFIYLGDDRNIARVWVKGRVIKSSVQ